MWIIFFIITGGFVGDILMWFLINKKFGLWILQDHKNGTDSRYIVSILIGATTGLLIWVNSNLPSDLCVWSILFLITLGICAITDEYGNVVIPILDMILLILGFVIAFNKGVGFIAVLMSLMVIGVYSMIYVWQQAHAGNINRFEVRGFGLADLILVISVSNATSPLYLGICLILSPVICNVLRWVLFSLGYVGGEVQGSRSFPLYPYVVFGMGFLSILSLL